MKRYSETVLNGHPDKFCDLIADRMVREVSMADPEACAQIEVSVWSDIVFLTGGIITRKRPGISFSDVIKHLGEEIGYDSANHIDVSRYRIIDEICYLGEDPHVWTDTNNDQSIITGYAGYDRLTRFLPPEHYLCWYFRGEITKSMKNGHLTGHGPDGKILAVITEDAGGWRLDKLLVTIQQAEKAAFTDFTDAASLTLASAYGKLQEADRRWNSEWKDVEVLINPNGPLVNGGSDGDNGQTGRKLVMDFYGPRIPVGGGALYGKDLRHIDRLGAAAARKFAVGEVLRGAKEVIVKICYAPGLDEPLTVDIVSDKRPKGDIYKLFSFSEMKKSILASDLDYDLISLGSFYNDRLSFNT